jgi:hypothetical protein
MFYSTRANVIKLFTSQFTYVNKKLVFVPDKPFQSSLIVVNNPKNTIIKQISGAPL